MIKRVMRKKAQTEISFGMIFSVILIVAFVVFAIYAVNMFLGWRDKGQISIFANDFQGDVNSVWTGTESTGKPVQYDLPTKIQFVCIIDFSKPLNQNDKFKNQTDRMDNKMTMFLYPKEAAGDMSAKTIEHLNLNKITATENPYCIKNIQGKIKITLSKEYSENLVSLERQ